ncbi:hypothetical protein JCM13664_20270 [Methylothermus subterraneus]
MNTAPKFTCLLLAADRPGPNPVAKAAGVPAKSLVPLAGQALLARVLEALARCPAIERCLLVGPSSAILADHPIASSLKAPWIDWIPPESSPSLSALAGLSRVPEDRPVLLTCADLAFPSSQVFEDFCRKSSSCGGDVAVGLIPYAQVVARFPGIRRTLLRFSDGPFCTCNLFAFLTPEGRRIVAFWRALEQERKRPWRLIRALGSLALIRYLLGRLSTLEVSQQVEKKLGLRVNFIVLPYPEAAIDVDTEDDLRRVLKLLEPSPPGRAENSAPSPRSNRVDRCGSNDRRAR